MRTLYTACKHRGFVTVTYFDLRAAMGAAATVHGSQLGVHSLEVHFSAPKQSSADSSINQVRGGRASSCCGRESSCAAAATAAAAAAAAESGTAPARARLVCPRLMEPPPPLPPRPPAQGTIALFNLDPNTSNEQLVWIFSKFGDVKEIRDSADRPNQKFIEFYDVRCAAAGGGLLLWWWSQWQWRVGHWCAGCRSGALRCAARPALVACCAGRQPLPRPPPALTRPRPHPAPPRHAAAALHAMNRAEHSHRVPGSLGGGAGELSQADLAELAAAAAPPHLSSSFQDAVRAWLLLRPGACCCCCLASGWRPLLPSGAWCLLAQVQQQAPGGTRHQTAAAGCAWRPLPCCSARPPPPRCPADAPRRPPAAPQQALLGTSPASQPSAWEARSRSGSDSSLYQLFSGQQGGGAGSGAPAGGGAGGAPAFGGQQSASQLALQQLLAQQASAAGVGGGDGLKLVDAAQQLLSSAAAAGRGMHVSDSASSIGGSQQALFGGGASIASQLQSLAQGGQLAQYGDKQPGALEALLQQGVGDAVVQQLLAGGGLGGLNISDPASASLLLGLAGAGGGGGGGADLWHGAGLAQAQLGGFGGGMQQQQQQQLGGSLSMADLSLQQQQQQLALQLAQLQAQAMSLPGPSAAQLLQAQLNQQALLRALLPHGAAGPTAALANAAQLLQQAQLSAQLASAGVGFRPGQFMAGSGAGAAAAAAAQREQRGGRLSRRVTDPSLEAERKAQQEKLFALDAERILSGEDKRTTLMIKNIPNKYTQKMLLASVEEHFRGMFDFFYLPIDFKNKCNVRRAALPCLPCLPCCLQAARARADRRLAATPSRARAGGLRVHQHHAPRLHRALRGALPQPQVRARSPPSCRLPSPPACLPSPARLPAFPRLPSARLASAPARLRPADARPPACLCRWERFNSEKVCHITYARIQGKAALVSHFQNSSLMNEDKRCRPMLFISDGPNQGEPEPFPVGPAVKPRAPHVAGFAANARGR